MRIALLGDASENTASYVRGLSDRGHDVHVLSFRSGRIDLQASSSRSLGTRGKWEYLLRVGHVRRWVMEVKPDLLLGYRITSYGLVGALVGFRPFAVTATGFDVLWGLGWRRRVIRHVLSNCDLCVSWAPHMTRAFHAIHATVPVITIPRGVSLETFHPGNGHALRRSLTVVSTRTLTRWYRYQFLLCAFRDVLKTVPAARLVIAGEGPEKHDIERVARELGVSTRVSLPGRLPSTGIAELLRESSVYVTQIPFDGVSASLLEAMASGVVPVVPDNESNRDWVFHNVGGLLYPPDDLVTFRDSLIRALTDNVLRERAISLNLQQVRLRADRAVNTGRIAVEFERLVADRRAEPTSGRRTSPRGRAAAGWTQ